MCNLLTCGVTVECIHHPCASHTSIFMRNLNFQINEMGAFCSKYGITMPRLPDITHPDITHQDNPNLDIPTRKLPIRSHKCRIKLEQLERLRSENTPNRLMITHTMDSYQIPCHNKTKSKLQIPRICQKFKFYNFTIKFTSCLIRCANMKWIRLVMWKI